MKLRAPFALIALVGWSIASAPAIASGDPTITIKAYPDGKLAGTFPLERYVQNSNDRSVTADASLNATSANLLLVPPGYTFPEAIIADAQGPAALITTFKTCLLTSASTAASGSSTTVHFAFKCGSVEERVSTPPSPSPSPTPKPTPMLKLVEPLAHPAVKN